MKTFHTPETFTHVVVLLLLCRHAHRFWNAEQPLQYSIAPVERADSWLYHTSHSANH
jgi:hypothetical protein